MRLRALYLLVALAAASLADSAGSHSTGMAPRAAGVRAAAGVALTEGCATCHTGAASTSDEHGEVELRGLPEQYIPGRRYTVTFTIRHAAEDRLRWGFLVTAVTAETHRAAGRLVATDRQNTESSSSPEGYGYVSHSYPGTAIGRSEGQSWSFDWLAPEDNVGRVVFLGVGLAANADGTERGDLVYGSTPEEPLAVVPPRAPEPSRHPALAPLLERE